MGHEVQNGVVLALVLLAAVYCIWYLLPAKIKKRLGVVHRKLADGPSCGACSQCGTCSAVPPGAGGAATSAAVQPITFQRKP